MSKVLLTRLGGVVFLGVLVGLVGLSVALYQKAFTDVVPVTLRADRSGNQLTPPADVKMRGLVVGEVREVRTDGDGAVLELALQPDKVDLIPANVQARLLPKTLFGEKFVSLVEPEQPAAEPIAAGDVIPQDRSEVALETQTVLDDLQPLLQALRPQQLAVTLNALSGALRGRGDRLGGNLVAVDQYFRQLNPEMPVIQEDIRRLAALVETYDQAAPDLLGLLEELSAVNRNLVDQRQELERFLGSTTGSVEEIDSFLRENERRLVRLAADSRAPLELFARYSPVYPCLAKGLAEYDPVVSSTFGGLQPGLHITLEFTQDQDPYLPGDEPRYLDARDPTCEGLPDPPVPQDDDEFRDGYRDRERASVDEQPDGSGGADGVRTAAAADPARFLVGDSAQSQHALLAAVAAPRLGVAASEVPDLVDLLFGPLARGTTVRIS